MDTSKELIFEGVFNGVLDYADKEFKAKLARWGLGVFDRIKADKRDLLSTDTSEKGVQFMYALTLARIIGEFGKVSFDDLRPEEVEIRLGELEMTLEDVGGLLNEDIDPKRKDKHLETNVINIEDVWNELQECKSDIFQYLVPEINKGDPTPVYNELVALFGRNDDEEEGVIISPFSGHSMGKKMSAFAYVSEGFQH